MFRIGLNMLCCSVCCACFSCGCEAASEPDLLGVASPAFAEGETIPLRFTCDGVNISPPLVFEDAPVATRSFAVVLKDLDAPGGALVSWLIWNVPGNVRYVSEGGFGALAVARRGTNDKQQQGYFGPCPSKFDPYLREHRYDYRVFALDQMLELQQGATAAALRHAMDGHVLAEGSLVGKYQRQ